MECGAGGTESSGNSPEKGPMGGVMFMWLFVLRVSQRLHGDDWSHKLLSNVENDTNTLIYHILPVPI